MEKNEKILTMEELKSAIADGVKESVGGEIASLKTEVASLKAGKFDPKAESAEKSAEFIKALVNGDMPKKTIGTGSASFGYTVPTSLASAIHETKDKIAKIRANAFVFQMNGNFQLPTQGTGVSAYWVSTEADVDLTESNPTVGKTDLVDNYLASRVRIPLSLLETSALNIEQFVSRLSGRALTSKEETAFVAGSGTSEPEGLRTASITGIAQAGANLAYDDLINLLFGVPEQYRANGVFGASTGAIKKIMKLKDVNGLPIFDPATSMLLGKKLLELTDIPENLGTSANETEIYFGDLQEYWIKEGTAMRAETQNVSGRLQVDLFVYESVDGVVVNTDAFRKLTGVK